MELEKKTFPNGRHRNKTYLFVYENDKEFCRMVMNGEKSRFIPEDFSDFLITKMEPLPKQRLHSVAAKNGRQFVNALAINDEMRRQFQDLVGEFDVHVRKMHSPCTDAIPNGFFSIFYRFFAQKHVANITNKDWHCKYLDKSMAIFPFPVSNEVVSDDIDILDFIDDKLMAEMQTFLNEHFDRVEIRPICRKFFANISNCEEKNVPEKAILAAVEGLDLKGLSASCRGDRNVNKECEYLKAYPRVNDAGVIRYQRIYNMIVEVTRLHEKPCNVSALKYENDYLLKLPEINFYELYSLLNVDFFNSDRHRYVFRFKKYLFFFINALNDPSKAVFFIDDGLFECLLHYKALQRSRDDVETLKFELSMLSLANRRKRNFETDRDAFYLENDSLRGVKNYFDSFPDVANSWIDHEIRTELLGSYSLISNELVALNLVFRTRLYKPMNDFWELIIYGALLPNSVERLVVYNACNGQETSILMPPNKDAIIEFIRKYNKYDFSPTCPPEKFLTSDLERYYEGDVTKWDSKQKFEY